jgi:hypothetical protein
VKRRSTWLIARDNGFALLSALLLLILGLTLGAASLVYSTLDLKSTSHYVTGNQALFAAEAGVVHSLSNINRVGVIDFGNDVVDRWAEVLGTETLAVPGHPDVHYEVQASADPADPINRGILTAVGLAPLRARRILRITLRKDAFAGGPGAIHLAPDAMDSSFRGNTFEVDGNDHDAFGALTGGSAVPGISTRNDAVTDSVTDSLGWSQKDNVRGLGFSLDPLKPSVETTGGPSVSDLDNIVSEILETPGAFTTDVSTYTGGDVFGTLDSPQITHMTSDGVQLNGDASGAGILVVDGSLTINGNLDFVGWILVRGNTIINTDVDTNVVGNATIMGTLWTGNLQIQVGGSAIIDYCSSCLQMIDGLAPPDKVNLVPRPMVVTSWQEIL